MPNLATLIFLAVALWPGAARAEPGFFRATDFPRGGVTRALADFASRAAFQSPPNGCTFAPIGPGIALTALHCVLDPSHSRIERSPDSGVEIRTQISPIGPPVLVTGGTVAVLHETKLRADAWNPSMADYVRTGLAGDWAILAIPTGDHPCIEPESGGGPAGDDLIAGFPAASPRPEHPSTGVGLYLTHGARAADLSGNPFYERELAPSTYALLGEILMPAIQGGDLLVIDADAAPGNSGSPVFDTGGMLAGIVTFGLVPPGRLGHYVPDSAAGVGITSVMRGLRAQGLRPSDYFRCGAQKR